MRKDNARGEIVEKEYPFDLENWMPLKEALKLLGMGRKSLCPSHAMIFSFSKEEIDGIF